MISASKYLTYTLWYYGNLGFLLITLNTVDIHNTESVQSLYALGALCTKFTTCTLCALWTICAIYALFAPCALYTPCALFAMCAFCTLCDIYLCVQHENNIHNKRLIWVNNNCVASLQNGPLVSNFWFALTYRTHQDEHLEEENMSLAPLFTDIWYIKH